MQGEKIWFDFRYSADKELELFVAKYGETVSVNDAAQIIGVPMNVMNNVLHTVPAIKAVRARGKRNRPVYFIAKSCLEQFRGKRMGITSAPGYNNKSGKFKKVEVFCNDEDLNMQFTEMRRSGMTCPPGCM